MREVFKRGSTLIGTPRFPLWLLWGIVIAVHLFLPTNGGDDAWFMQILAGELATPQNWLRFLIERYQTWSSRVVIEGLLILFVRFPILWRVSNAAVCVLSTVAIDRLWNPEQDKKKNWILFVSFFFFPLDVFYEVGYVATTLNYLWPLCACLWALTPPIKLFFGRRVAAWEYAVAAVALLFASFSEQACAVMLAACLASAGYQTIAHHRTDLYSIAGVLACVLMLVYTFTCPGNRNRVLLETAANFPEFSDFSLLQKLEIGFSSMMKTAFLSPNVFVAGFCLLVTLAVYRTSRSFCARIFSAIPFAVSLLCGVLGGALENAVFPIRMLREAVGKAGTAPTLHDPMSWLPLLLFVLLLFCLLYALRVVIRDTRCYLFFLLLLAFGAASRIAMGLSPTVWASGERTCTLLYASIAAVFAYLIFQVAFAQASDCDEAHRSAKLNNRT